MIAKRSARLCTYARLGGRLGLYFGAPLCLMTSAAHSQQAGPLRQPDSAALAALLADAARVNSRIPQLLLAYRARIESEMSLVVLDSGGLERTVQLEQVASDVRWRAPDRYDQRVIGYREQSVGPMFSLMSFFGGWTVPTLYGNHLQLGVTSATDPNKSATIVGQSLAIHPLAPDRDTYYLYEGGDTAVTLVSNGREIPIVSVRVTPRANAPGDAILFYGEMYLDADWKQIVRMRGRLVEVHRGKVTIKSGSRLPGVSGASFVELVNSEVNGQYWLPAFQRTEIEARIGLFGDFRSILRIVSRFNDYRVNDSTWNGPEAPPGVRHNLTFASAASQGRFHDWENPIGAASSDVYYGQFNDLAPEEWRNIRSGSGLRFRPRSLAEVFRFNRIEGAFTGLPLERELGDSNASVVAHGSLGWAWAERTARGSLDIQRTRGQTLSGVRVERSLANTNDFQLPFSWGSTLSALFGSRDDFDYLNRTSGTAYFSRALGAQRRSYARVEIGAARDDSVRANVSRGFFVAKGSGFRPNRGIVSGAYLRSALSLEINPDVSGLFVDRGVGLGIRYERADGALRSQRLELRTAARREVGSLQLFARVDAGTHFGPPLPQTMFEIGSGEGLTAYGYKEFGGDRAALARAVVGYTLPVMRAPMHFPSHLIVPGIAPGFAAGIHTAWTEVSSAAAQRALEELGMTSNPGSGVLVPVSKPTDGIRASAEFLFTLFNGALAAGVTRVIDTHGAWKFTARIGQGF
ncbi:MAG TPA: hypothetical protein VE110_08080 [Gemmatimonadaceae bacterium]|nr:hypothetical protein [Gemmatimonadaceae bacterium]